jgi:hypothetical protein
MSRLSTLTHDEFMEYAAGEIERQVDDAILAQTDKCVQRTMVQHRELIVSKMMDTTALIDLRRRLAEAEERRLRVVQ